MTHARHFSQNSLNHPSRSGKAWCCRRVLPLLVNAPGTIAYVDQFGLDHPEVGSATAAADCQLAVLDVCDMLLADSVVGNAEPLVRTYGSPSVPIRYLTEDRARGWLDRLGLVHVP